MAIRNYRTISAEELMTKLVPHTGIMPDQVILDMKDFIAAEKDFIMIFRDVEFKVLLSDAKAYVEKVKGEFDQLGVFSSGPEDIIPPAVNEAPKPLSGAAVDRGVAAKHPKSEPTGARRAGKREIPPEFRAKDTSAKPPGLATKEDSE